MIDRASGSRAVKVFCAILLSTVAAGHPAQADNANLPVDREDDARVGQVADIVMTARHVIESLQRVPIAVTGFDATTIRAMQIQNFGDIGKMVPNLEAQRQFGSASARQFYVRNLTPGRTFTLAQPVGTIRSAKRKEG
jgi:iron complex outermembrane receptor protein